MNDDITAGVKQSQQGNVDDGDSRLYTSGSKKTSLESKLKRIIFLMLSSI